MPKLTDHISFKKDGLAARYAHGRIPMATLYEAYFDGDLDIPGDIYALLRERQVVKLDRDLQHPRLRRHFPHQLVRHRAVARAVESSQFVL